MPGEFGPSQGDLEKSVKPELMEAGKEKLLVKGTGETKPKYENQPNQDTLLIDDEKRIYGVFDGVGGSIKGEEASALTAQTVSEFIRSQEFKTEIELKNMLVAALEASDKKLVNTDNQTTASVAGIWENGEERKLVFSHIGDSRIYLLREDQLSQVTTDHSLTTDAISDGWVTQEEAKKVDQATQIEDLAGSQKLMTLFRQRNVVNKLVGAGDMDPDSGVVDLKKGDKIILTSDGIHDNLTNSEIVEAIRGENPASNLVKEAKKRAGEGQLRSKNDDMTTVIVDINS